jgi:hypothetical protein
LIVVCTNHSKNYQNSILYSAPPGGEGGLGRPLLPSAKGLYDLMWIKNKIVIQILQRY